MRFLFIITAVLCCYSAPVFAQNADEPAIKDMLLAAGKAAATEPFAKVAQTYWVLDANTILYNSFMDGSFVEMNGAQMQASNSAPAAAEIQQSNYLIVQNGNAASATYDQVNTAAGGAKSFTHKMVFLEKIGGTWKFHLLTSHEYLP